MPIEAHFLYLFDSFVLDINRFIYFVCLFGAASKIRTQVSRSVIAVTDFRIYEIDWNRLHDVRVSDSISVQFIYLHDANSAFHFFNLIANRVHKHPNADLS